MTALRTILGGTLMLVHLLAGSAWSAQDKTGIAEGKRIYTEGILPGEIGRAHV